jgi:hypothetical protein
VLRRRNGARAGPEPIHLRTATKPRQSCGFSCRSWSRCRLILVCEPTYGAKTRLLAHLNSNFDLEQALSGQATSASSYSWIRRRSCYGSTLIAASAFQLRCLGLLSNSGRY